MKEFGEWVNSLAGSIEDASIVKKEQPSKEVYKTPSELMVRMYFANLLKPKILNPTDAIDWMDIFTLDVDIITGTLCHCPLSSLIGRTLADAWYNFDDDDWKNNDFIRDLKTSIRKGMKKGDS